MPRLNIPARHRPGIAVIMRLDDAAIDKLVAALSRVSGTSTSAASILAKIPPDGMDIPSGELPGIVRAILVLYSLRIVHEQTASELVDDVIEAIRTSDYQDLRLDEDREAEFHDKLTRLLSIDSIGHRLKVRDLQSEHERWICTARIITDIRPVFGLSHDSDPVDAFVTHTLKITYHEGSQTKEIFFSMDDDGVQDLRDILDRAEMKSEKLNKVIGSMELHRAD